MSDNAWPHRQRCALSPGRTDATVPIRPRPRAPQGPGQSLRPEFSGRASPFAGFSQDLFPILRSGLRYPLKELAPFNSELQFQHRSGYERGPSMSGVSGVLTKTSGGRGIASEATQGPLMSPQI